MRTLGSMKTQAGKQLIVVGDRVLIAPEDDEKTNGGLFLPPGAQEENAVRRGTIVATGPGAPIGAEPPSDDEDEPWKSKSRAGTKPFYFPMQAQERDTAIFYRRAAVEIKLDDKTYVIVPHGAILAILRDGKAVVSEGL